MKIYLAGGFSVICKKEKEKEYIKKFLKKGDYNRLYSYHFMNEPNAFDNFKLLMNNKGNQNEK